MEACVQRFDASFLVLFEEYSKCDENLKIDQLLNTTLQNFRGNYELECYHCCLVYRKMDTANYSEIVDKVLNFITQPRILDQWWEFSLKWIEHFVKHGLQSSAQEYLVDQIIKCDRTHEVNQFLVKFVRNTTSHSSKLLVRLFLHSVTHQNTDLFLSVLVKEFNYGGMEKEVYDNTHTCFTIDIIHGAFKTIISNLDISFQSFTHIQPDFKNRCHHFASSPQNNISNLFKWIELITGLVFYFRFQNFDMDLLRQLKVRLDHFKITLKTLSELEGTVLSLPELVRSKNQNKNALYNVSYVDF